MRNALVLLAVVALLILVMGGLNNGTAFNVDYAVGTVNAVSVFWVSAVIAALVFIVGLVAAWFAQAAMTASRRKLEAELQSTYERLREAEALAARPAPATPAPAVRGRRPRPPSRSRRRPPWSRPRSGDRRRRTRQRRRERRGRPAVSDEAVRMVASGEADTVVAGDGRGRRRGRPTSRPRGACPSRSPPASRPPSPWLALRRRTPPRRSRTRARARRPGSEAADAGRPVRPPPESVPAASVAPAAVHSRGDALVNDPGSWRIAPAAFRGRPATRRGARRERSPRPGPGAPRARRSRRGERVPAPRLSRPRPLSHERHGRSAAAHRPGAAARGAHRRAR